MNTIFVTGAEGFAGAHLTQYLRQQGFQVIAGVRNRGRKLAYERQFGKAFVCDVGDPIGVARCIASIKPDAIIHLAGVSQPAFAAQNPLIAYQSTVNATANLLDAVRRAVPRCRVVLTSACEVYGDVGNDDQPLFEDGETNPVNLFGAFKQTAESVAHAFFDSYHLNISIARPFHFTGADQGDAFFFASVAQQFANWTPEAGPNIEFPDLHCRRELLHVKDVVTALETILVNGKPDETYNIAGNHAHTVREIIETLISIAGRPFHLLPAEEATPNPVQSLRGDNHKLTHLGWQPQHTLSDALRDLYHSFTTRNHTAKAAATH